MSADDFAKMIQRVNAQESNILGDADDQKEWLYSKIEVMEEYIRYMSTGGVNSHHATKVARLFMQGFNISKKSPK